MELYDLLFADQDLEALLVELDPPEGSPMAVARARLWEGRFDEAASIAAGTNEPWSSFLVSAARLRAGLGAKRTLLALAEDPDQDSRVRLWAWTGLRNSGEKPSGPFVDEVLGLVLEVVVDDGTDVLAAYADGGVRFLGHAGNAIARDAELDATVDAVIAEAQVLGKLPPQKRTGEPVAEDRDIRMTALTARGTHVVEVNWADIEEGGTYAKLFAAATKLLEEVTTA